MNDKTWEHIDKYAEKIGAVIEQLAKKLGVASEYVYTTLVRQQFADGIVDLTLSILGVIATISFLIVSIKFGEKADADEVNFHGAMAIAVGLLGVLCAALTAVVFLLGVPAEAIKKLINPDYYAIKELLELLGNLK